MDHEPLGAVVVGTGFGVLTHVRAMQAAGIEVLALVGRDAAKASDRAARFGVPHATTDPDDLPVVAPDPPPSDLLHTAYDMWHSMGVDLAPYTRLYERLRDRAAGRPVSDDPVAATFVDGVATQRVLDAIHTSAAGGAWVSATSA